MKLSTLILGVVLALLGLIAAAPCAGEQEKEKESGGPKRGWRVLVRTGDISPSGKYDVLVYEGDQFGMPRTYFKVWDVDNRISLAELDAKRHKDDVFLCRFLADDKQVITMSFDGTVVLHRVKEKLPVAEVVQTFSVTGGVNFDNLRRCHLSDNGKHLLVFARKQRGKPWQTSVWGSKRVFWRSSWMRIVLAMGASFRQTGDTLCWAGPSAPC
jgi:hypothetical protein